MSNAFENQIVRRIYHNLFLKEIDYSINIFLCGSNLKQKKSLRSLIYDEIKNDSKYNVVFPEWLFSDLLASKNHNLLKLENELAENVDAIIIPLEGLGTFAELGAFSTFDGLVDKIIVVNEKQFRGSNSFVNIGPIKLIREMNAQNIIYYDRKNIKKMKEDVLRRLKSLRSSSSKLDIQNLFNLSRFISYIIAIYQPVTIEEIEVLITNPKLNLPNHFVKPCIEILVHKELIERKNVSDITKYILTETGHYYIYEDLLPRLHIIKVFSKIRASIINKQYRKTNELDWEAEEQNF